MQRMICRVLAIAAVAFACFSAATSQNAQNETIQLTKREILDRWADALGGRRSLQIVRTIHLRGKVNTGGSEGTYERWATSRGQLLTSIRLSGGFRQTTVFDGRTAWVQDSSGNVHELSGEMLRGIISSAYEASVSFLLSARMRGSVSLAGEEGPGNEFVVRLEPEDGAPLTVYLDKRTFLPAREESEGAIGRRVISFSDWRDMSGVKYPREIRQSNGDSQFDTVISIEQIEINPEQDANLFVMPVSVAKPIHFLNGTRQATFPAEVFGEHIFVPVRINGSRAGWFFLDSGAAVSVVSDSLAKEAGLTAGGVVRGQGTGTGSSMMSITGGIVLELPGVQVPPGTIAVWDLASIMPALGHAWDGLVGYDVISRLVVRMDYEHKQITLYDPPVFVPDNHATAFPLTFLGNMPVIDATIMLRGQPPIQIKCAIDSGADGFHLTAPFVRANHVLDSMQKTISISSIGAGGESPEIAGRIAGLQLGPYLLREPVTALSLDLKEGILASPDIGALMGGEILRHFTVTFDYPHRRVLMEPNDRFSDPFRANESGLSLLARGKDFHRFEVDGVEAHSPAASAGLRKGDVVVALNGHAAEELDLEKIDEMLQHSPGRLPIVVEREGRKVSMILKLKNRI